MEKIISILTPCYNGEKYIDRYAASLLAQEYSNCQLIFMDDGSKDNTRDKIMSYKDKFEKKGFSFEYHYHDNIGPGGTIAKGLKYVKGDYLVWPDVDDAMTPDSLIKKLSFLENNPQFGIVRTDYQRIIEDGLSTRFVDNSIHNNKSRFNERLFLSYLLNRGAWFQPGCFMVKMSAFLESNPTRYIFPSRRGQNWQMLLPVFYKFDCGYIDEPLYLYYIHKGNHSASATDGYDNIIKSYDQFEEIIIETLNHMEMDDCERNHYVNMVRNNYMREKLSRSFENKKFDEARRYFNQLKTNNQATYKDYLKTKRFIFAIYHLLKRGKKNDI